MRSRRSLEDQGDRSPLILIVDDDAIARDTLEALLARQGYDLVFAAGGEEALVKAGEATPDLIMLDVMMPGMDGFEVCRRLRADPEMAQIPVIMLTGLDDRDSWLRGIEAGADDFIPKPFNWNELRARVRTITWLSRQRRMRAIELQRERDRTKSILEALGEAVVVADLYGRIEYINPAATNLTGFTAEEAVGRNWRLWQSDHGSHDSYEQIEAIVSTGQDWRGEVVSKSRDGKEYDTMLTVAPLFDAYAGHSPVGFVSVQRDITPLKEAERLKDRFVSNVSHELNTPLSVIMLLADNLETLYGRLPDEKRQKMIHDIQRHAQILTELVQDILNISRFDSQRISLARERIDLTQLVLDQVQEQTVLAREKALELRLITVEPICVWGNAAQIQRAIRNLLNNAIKYTPSGGLIVCECRLCGVPDTPPDGCWPGSRELTSGRWGAVRVSDTGIGIGSEHLPHLFERFYRTDPQGNVRGSGLGLSIVKEVIELHNGQVAVHSIPGEGSTFAVYLPLGKNSQ